MPRQKPSLVYLVLISAVLAITAFAGLALVLCGAWWPDPTSTQQTIIAAMDNTFKGGVGAIFGLLGARHV